MSESPVRRRSRGELPDQGHTTPSGRSGTPADESIGYLTRYAYRAFVRALAEKLGPHGIASGEWSALRVLWERDGLSQVELAQRMRVEKASLTSVLNNMQSKGLIDRTGDRGDRRKVLIKLTARGRRLKEQLLPYGENVNAVATRGMSAAEIAQLRALLGKLIGNLDASSNEPR
jgi:DNA-binding MarR family transcriptional regulator